MEIIIARDAVMSLAHQVEEELDKEVMRIDRDLPERVI
jgi:hypothetical protein